MCGRIGNKKGAGRPARPRIEFSKNFNRSRRGRLSRRPVLSNSRNLPIDTVRAAALGCPPYFPPHFVHRAPYGPDTSSREPLNLGLQVFALRRWLGSSFPHRATARWGPYAARRTQNSHTRRLPKKVATLPLIYKSGRQERRPLRKRINRISRNSMVPRAAVGGGPYGV